MARGIHYSVTRRATVNQEWRMSTEYSYRGQVLFSDGLLYLIPAHRNRTKLCNKLKRGHKNLMPWWHNADSRPIWRLLSSLLLDNARTRHSLRSDEHRSWLPLHQGSLHTMFSSEYQMLSTWSTLNSPLLSAELNLLFRRNGYIPVKYI
jgi:hypothetical protein